jgi:NAD(P)H-flavin reductase
MKISIVVDPKHKGPPLARSRRVLTDMMRKRLGMAPLHDIEVVCGDEAQAAAVRDQLEETGQVTERSAL